MSESVRREKEEGVLRRAEDLGAPGCRIGWCNRIKYSIFRRPSGEGVNR